MSGTDDIAAIVCPYAKDRRDPIVTTDWPKVQHLPKRDNSRNTHLYTACNKRGWFWRLSQPYPDDLPVCAECVRRTARLVLGRDEKNSPNAPAE